MCNSTFQNGFQNLKNAFLMHFSTLPYFKMKIHVVYYAKLSTVVLVEATLTPLVRTGATGDGDY